MVALSVGSFLLPGLVFLLVAGSIVAIGHLCAKQPDERLVGRVDALCADQRDRSPPEKQYRGMLRLLVPQVPREMLDALLPNDEGTRSRLQAQLAQAGIYSPTALTTYVTLKLFLMTAPPIACLLCGGFGLIPPMYALLAGGVAGMLGMIVPSLWLQRLRDRRQSLLRRSLSDFLDLVVTCLEGGMSMPAALKQVTDELLLAHPVLASELQMVLREMELGRNLQQALSHLATRTGVDELRTLSTFVQQAARVGSTMADAVRQLADMLRQQREHRAEEQSQKAAVKILLPMLLFIFPSVLIVLAGPAAIQIHERLTKTSQLGEIHGDDK